MIKKFFLWIVSPLTKWANNRMAQVNVKSREETYQKYQEIMDGAPQSVKEEVVELRQLFDKIRNDVNQQQMISLLSDQMYRRVSIIMAAVVEDQESLSKIPMSMGDVRLTCDMLAAYGMYESEKIIEKMKDEQTDNLLRSYNPSGPAN